MVRMGDRADHLRELTPLRRVRDPDGAPGQVPAGMKAGSDHIAPGEAKTPPLGVAATGTGVVAQVGMYPW